MECHKSRQFLSPPHTEVEQVIELSTDTKKELLVDEDELEFEIEIEETDGNVFEYFGSRSDLDVKTGPDEVGTFEKEKYEILGLDLDMNADNLENKQQDSASLPFTVSKFDPQELRAACPDFPEFQSCLRPFVSFSKKQIAIPDNSSFSRLLCCFVCFQTFVSNDAYSMVVHCTRHFASGHFQCQFCSKGFITLESCMKHETDLHDQRRSQKSQSTVTEEANLDEAHAQERIIPSTSLTPARSSSSGSGSCSTGARGKSGFLVDKETPLPAQFSMEPYQIELNWTLQVQKKKKRKNLAICKAATMSNRKSILELAKRGHGQPANAKTHGGRGGGERKMGSASAREFPRTAATATSTSKVQVAKKSTASASAGFTRIGSGLDSQKSSQTIIADLKRRWALQIKRSAALASVSAQAAKRREERESKKQAAQRDQFEVTKREQHQQQQLLMVREL